MSVPAHIAKALDDLFPLGWHHMPAQDARKNVDALIAGLVAERDAPIDMVLHCPACGMQHVDAPEWQHVFADNGAGALDLQEAREAGLWVNDPHRSHLCHGCGHIWRPADVPTNGVAAITTKGKNDSPIAARTPKEPT